MSQDYTEEDTKTDDIEFTCRVLMVQMLRGNYSGLTVTLPTENGETLSMNVEMTCTENNIKQWEKGMLEDKA